MAEWVRQAFYSTLLYSYVLFLFVSFYFLCAETSCSHICVLCNYCMNNDSAETISSVMPAALVRPKETEELSFYFSRVSCGEGDEKKRGTVVPDSSERPTLRVNIEFSICSHSNYGVYANPTYVDLFCIDTKKKNKRKDEKPVAWVGEKLFPSLEL